MGAINWHTFFFLLYALVACGFAVAVVVSTNIVRMALCLIVSLGATSGLFFLAGADFVAAMQLMIYVGGTLVLLIFGVMLTARGPFISMKTGGGDWIVAVLLSGCLGAILIPASLSVVAWQHPRQVAATEAPAAKTAAVPAARVVATAPGDEDPLASALEPATAENAPADEHAPAEQAQDNTVTPTLPKTATPIGLALLGARVDQLAEGPEAPAALKPGMSGYLLPFELVSVHLLVVLIGAAYLARTKRRAR